MPGTWAIQISLAGITPLLQFGTSALAKTTALSLTVGKPD
jgi:hypothetical protein